MSKIIDFINQIMLYSGQFALFYLLMQYSKEPSNLIFDLGHFVLLIALIFQTVALMISKKPFSRFLFAFISPLAYTIVEIKEGIFVEWFLNTGHFFFWVYTLLIAILQYNNDITKNKNTKIYTEFLITFISVTTFIFIYFIADRLEVDREFLINNIFDDVNQFASEATHKYIILAGFFLALSISISRVKIVQLNKKISTLLEHYMDKKIKEKLLNSDSNSNKNIELVILFSDIRGFTKLSEEMESSKVIEILNIFFGTWNQVISKRDGFISKFIGDEVMILFGLDTNIATASENSVKSAFEFANKINKNLENSNLPKIDFGIGINAGQVVIGNIGGNNRYDYTVIGDNVNIASRIQALCKIYKKRILISKNLFENLPPKSQDRFEFLAEEILRGKSNKLEIYKLRARE